MNSATLLDNFDLLAEAPGGVPKLRELILYLAASGRLLEANGAADLWPQVKLTQLASKIGSGATPAGGRHAYKTHGIPLIRSMNVHFRGFDKLGLAFIDEEQAARLDNVIVQCGDVLLNITGASIGRVTTAPSDMAGARVNQHVSIIRPTERLLARYLELYLASPIVQNRIVEIEVGATREALTKAKIEDFDILLPPLPEQHRIVAKVDELMALCDALEARQEAAHKTQTALTRSALHHLTAAPDPAECSKRWTFVHDNFQALEARPENVAELRKAILQLAVAGRLVPYRGAEHWPTRRFDAIAKISGGVTKGRRLIGRRLIELPYLRVANVQRGFLDLAVVKTIAIASDELDRYRLLPEDVLIVEGGDWDKVGRAAIWRGGIDVCLHQNHIFRARVDRAVVRPEWVQLALNSSGGRAYFEGASKQTTNLASINMTQLRGFPVLLPSVEYQIKTLASVDALMKLCDELEAGLKRERADAARLFDAVVARLMEKAA